MIYKEAFSSTFNILLYIHFSFKWNTQMRLPGMQMVFKIGQCSMKGPLRLTH